VNIAEGRPTVITQGTVQKLERAFRHGFNVSTACLYAGISRATYYQHTSSDPDFLDKMQLAQAWVTMRAKLVVVSAINNNSLPAAKWWLEHKARDEFGSSAINEDAQYKGVEHQKERETLREIAENLKNLR
jgi:hypothetical protein